MIVEKKLNCNNCIHYAVCKTYGNYILHYDTTRKICGYFQCDEAQPKIGKWIPVSERLPEKDVDVLACAIDEYGDTYITVTYHHIVWQTEVGGMHGKVEAWMPLPEPYKGGE